MSNTTVYPFGNNGTLPGSIGIANDLVTKNSTKALSAAQGVVLQGEVEILEQKDGNSVTVNPAGAAGGETVSVVIDSNNKWASTGGPYVGYIIPVTADKTYKFTNSSSGQCIVAFLKGTSHTSGTTPSFSNQQGFNKRIVIAQNATVKIAAPYDALYLYILSSVDGENRLSGLEVVGSGLQQAVIDGEEMSQTGYYSIAGMINASHEWDFSNDSFVLLPIRADMIGKKIELTANSTNNCTFAFLSSAPIVNGGNNPSFAYGGCRVVVTAGKMFTTIIPSGAKYIYCYALSGREFSKILVTENVPDKGSIGKCNGIYSWWVYPLAISTSGLRKKLIHGWVNASGTIGITVRDAFGGETKNVAVDKSPVDDHNAPAVIELANGKVAVIYTLGHNDTSNLYIRVTTTAGNYEAFDKRKVIAMGGNTSYVQVFLMGSTYYIFTRIGTTAWGYVTTTDFSTFSSPHTLISASVQYYVKFTPVTDNQNVLRISLYSNPSYADNGIRLGYIDFDSGNVYNNSISDSNIVGTLTGSTIANTAFTEIIPIQSGKQRLFDVAVSALNEVKIAFATFSSISSSNYHIYDNGTVHDICTGGPGFYTLYQGGISFRNPNQLILSRGDSDSDMIELWSKSSGTWSKDYTVYDEKRGSLPIRNIRPLFDTSGLFLLWQRGRYNSSSYTDWDMDVISTLFVRL